MFIVTGGAGFIGSNLVKELNRRGHTDILVVDDLGAGAKFRNLADLAIADYMDKREFRARVEGGKLGFTPAAILHNGARTDTLETDGHFMMENNFGDSKVLLHWALLHKVPMVYASSAEIYGANRDFATEPHNEKPMSVYGYAKLLFDQHVRSLMPHVETPLVGLRLFSVYGAREAHKGAMMSIPHQFLDQLRSSGACSIFGGCNGFADGEQARDFVFVGDIVDLSLHFALGGMAKGIFNAGTGEATTFNAVAQALIRQLGQGRIEYIPFPEALKGLYQSYTRADLRTLRAAGYTRAFTPLEAGIAKLVEEA